MATDITVRRSRRAVLGAALGGAAAVAATAVAKPLGVQAADAGNAIIGAANEGNTVTSFRNLDADEVSLAGIHAAAGTGVQGSSVTGPGIVGLSTDTTPTADLLAPSRKTGVWGAAGDTTGVFANTDEAGVFGFASLSPHSSGVLGQSAIGNGIQGVGDTGVFGDGYWGVYGIGRMGVVGDASATQTRRLRVHRERLGPGGTGRRRRLCQGAEHEPVRPARRGEDLLQPQSADRLQRFLEAGQPRRCDVVVPRDCDDADERDGRLRPGGEVQHGLLHDLPLEVPGQDRLRRLHGHQLSPDR
jgi:hypothetical protein